MSLAAISERNCPDRSRHRRSPSLVSSPRPFTRDEFSARWRPAQARWATTRLALRHRSSTTLGSPSELAGASDWLPLAALPPAPASTFGGREMLQVSASSVSGGVALSELLRAVVCAALASFISAINLGQTAGCPGKGSRLRGAVATGRCSPYVGWRSTSEGRCNHGYPAGKLHFIRNTPR